jgi:hypothetical protein
MIDSASHIPMASLTWDAAEAQRAIDEIVKNACARWDETRLWSAHPQDDGAKDGDTSLYLGAAGVIWALDNLARTGATREDCTFVGFRDRLVGAARLQRAALGDYGRHASLHFGDFPALLVAMRLQPADATRMQSMRVPAITTRSPSAS